MQHKISVCLLVTLVAYFLIQKLIAEERINYLLSDNVNDTSTELLLDIGKRNEGGWLVRALNYTPASLTPYRVNNSNVLQIQSYVFESLIKKNLNNKSWEGQLAQSWSVSNNGLDYIFNLRKAVSFSDGEGFDSGDVVFTYQFLMNEKIDAPLPRSYLQRLESVRAIDSHTVLFRFKEPYFQALQFFSNLPILPKHFYEKFLNNPSKFNSSTSEVLGTGPYKLPSGRAWAPGKGMIELGRNDRYWGKRGTFDKLVWKVITNKNAGLVAYRNGEVDVYQAAPASYRNLLKDKQIQSMSYSFEFMKPKQGYIYIAWNPVYDKKRTHFSNKRVRQAMTYLTDREAVADVAYHGYAEVVMSPFRKESGQHNAELTPREYNLSKAQSLLKQAGYDDRDNDGILENESGAALAFKLSYASDRDDSPKIALLLKDLYARAGVSVILDPQLSNVLYEKMDTKNFQALISGWGGGLEMDIYYTFHSDHAGPGGANFISYKNIALDQLIDETRTTLNEGKRMALWRETEKILYDEQPYTFLVRRKSLVFVSNRIKNLKVTSAGLNLNTLPLEVYVPKGLQKY